MICLSLLFFGTIFLIITILNYFRMQKEVTEGSKCPEEVSEVKSNWKNFWVFLIVSIAMVVIGGIGYLLGYGNV